MRNVFINELGNTIAIEVTKLSEDSINILIEGPNSSIDSTITRKEAIVLKDMLENTILMKISGE